MILQICIGELHASLQRLQPTTYFARRLHQLFRTIEEYLPPAVVVPPKYSRYSVQGWQCLAGIQRAADIHGLVEFAELGKFLCLETLGNGYLDGVLRLGCKGYLYTCDKVPWHYRSLKYTRSFLHRAHIKSRRRILTSVSTTLNWSDGLGQFPTRSGYTRSARRVIEQVSNWYC